MLVMRLLALGEQKPLFDMMVDKIPGQQLFPGALAIGEKIGIERGLLEGLGPVAVVDQRDLGLHSNFIRCASSRMSMVGRSVSHPPRVGPRVGPTMTPMPKKAIPVPTSSRGNASHRMAWEVDMSAPPPIPCTMRQKTSDWRESDRPHRSDATVNRMMEPTK